VIVQNARQDGIWLEGNGTTDFTLPTGDLEWRIYNVKTTFCVGNGFTNKAQSDMVIHGLIGYKNGGWGIQVFFATRMSASNFFLNTLGGSNAATGGDAAGFFGTDNQCTSATGVGLQIDVGADVGSSVISGVFGAPIAVKVGTQSNYITGQFVNSTTAAIQFIGAGSNANFIEGIVYGNTGTLVDWNAGSPGGGNSTILLGGTSPGGAATMFTGTTPTANTIWIDAVGLTGSPYRQFSSIDSSVSFTKAGVAVTFRNAANGYITIQNSASAVSSFIDFYNSSGTRLGFIGNHDAQNQWVSNANAPFVLSGADTRVKRIKASTDAGATTLVAGDFALSAGWGTTASIGSLRGVDQWHEFVITSAGTGQGANPTLTLTYKDLTWTVAPIVRCSRQEFASQPTVPFTVTTQSATTYVLTFGGTPVAGETYRVACFVGGI